MGNKLHPQHQESLSFGTLTTNDVNSSQESMRDSSGVQIEFKQMRGLQDSNRTFIEHGHDGIDLERKTWLNGQALHISDSLNDETDGVISQLKHASSEYSREVMTNRIQKHMQIIDSIHPILFGRVYESHSIELLARIVNWYNDYQFDLPFPNMKTLTLLDGALVQAIVRLKRFVPVEYLCKQESDNKALDCSACQKVIGESPLAIQRCGHAFHQICLTKDDKESVCSLCVQTCAVCGVEMSIQDPSSSLCSVSCGHIYHKKCIDSILDGVWPWKNPCLVCGQEVREKIYW